jgi:hypothetical protein
MNTLKSGRASVAAMASPITPAPMIVMSAFSMVSLYTISQSAAKNLERGRLAWYDLPTVNERVSPN